MRRCLSSSKTQIAARNRGSLHLAAWREGMGCDAMQSDATQCEAATMSVLLT